MNTSVKKIIMFMPVFLFMPVLYAQTKVYISNEQ